MKLKAQGRMNVIMKVFHFVSALCIRKVSCGHVRYYSVEGVFSLQPTCPHGQAQNSHPTVSGRHWVALGAAGRHVATSPLGTRPPRQGQCFSLGAEGRGRVQSPSEF